MAQHTKKERNNVGRGLAVRTPHAARPATAAGRPANLWSEMNRRFDEMRRDMDDIFWNMPMPYTPWIPSAAFMEMRPESRMLASLDVISPRTDIEDRGNELVVCADMPGIPKENVTINVTGTSIEITGEVENKTSEKEGSFTRQERSYSRFYRLLPLPEEVLTDKAEAYVRDGVLEVHLPKKAPTEEPKKKQVPVK